MNATDITPINSTDTLNSTINSTINTNPPRMEFSSGQLFLEGLFCSFICSFTVAYLIGIGIALKKTG
ncbi:MAG: hypothetical protein MJ252_04655 [archaeon]|nr:hypothetical protein [archaeon]